MEAAPALAAARRTTPRAALDALESSWLLPSALVLLAAALRLYHLGARSLWIDEVLVSNSVRYSTLPQVFDWTHTTIDQMPLMNIIVWLMRGLGGAEWVVRLPAAVAGSGTVLVLYLLGRALWRPRVSFLAALLMAVSPFGVFWSQEARPYSLLMFLTAAQMLLAYRSVVHSRPLDWAGFTAVTILDIYTHFVALAAAAAAFAFIGLVLAVDTATTLAAREPRVPRGNKKARRRPVASPSFQPVLTKLALSVLSAACIFVAYVPWLPWLRAFLSRPDLSSGHTTSATPLTLDGVRAFLAMFNFSDLLLGLLVLGFISAAVWLRTERWRAGAVVLCWLGLPILGFWWHVRGGIIQLQPRDLSFLVPAAVLTAAVGADAVGVAASWIWQRLRQRASAVVSAGIFGALALLLLQAALPPLAQTYAQPTDDYRAMARWIVAKGGPDSTVLAISCTGIVATSLSYYFWLLRSPILVLDATQLDDNSVLRLRQRHGPVWLAAHVECATPDFLALPRRGIEEKTFYSVELFRLAENGGGPVAQAERLLQWAAPADPPLISSVELIKVVSSQVRLGRNLLPPTADPGWVLTPGGSLLPDHQGFQLAPAGGEVNVMAELPSASGRTYIMSFRYRNATLSGWQHVFVSAHDAGGNWLAIYPYGGGYYCPPSAQWQERVFAFTTPPHTTSIHIWLRADGSGSAEFSGVTLRPVG